MQRALLNTVVPIIAGLAILTSPVEAQTPEQKGRAVAEEADRHDFGWHDNASIMRMVLKNRSGQERVRELRTPGSGEHGEGTGRQEHYHF